MKPDVVVTYVRGERVDGAFMESLLELQNTEPRIAQVYGRVSGPAVALMRNLACAYVLYQTDAAWMLMLDTDMTFDRDLAKRLLTAANPTTKPVVGGLCFAADTRGQEIKPTLYTGNGPDDVLWNYPRDYLQRVHATGAACLLIHRSVLEKLADHYSPAPWFADEIRDEKMMSEDRVFCHRLAEQGIPLYVHTGIRLGHMKVRPVTEESYFAQQRLERLQADLAAARAELAALRSTAA